MDIKRLFEKHPQWQVIVDVAEKLISGGYKVYLAGGCVRDALMGRSPHDFDIASSAQPDQVKALFPNAIDVGRAFGVMILPYEDFQVEVATFRKDGAYTDGRHPEGVEFSEPETDALRRDFTVNGLFYDLSSGQVIDYVGGKADIKKRVIRAIGDPLARFNEDKLRMLRSARFSAQLGFEVDGDTLRAIEKLKNEISKVSKERITEEFKKLARSHNAPQGFQVLKSTGLLAAILPNLQLVQTTYWDLFLRSQNELSPILTLEIMIACLMLFESFASQQSELNVEVSWEHLPFVLSRESKREIEFLIHGFFAMRALRDEALLLLNEEAGPLLTELCFVFADLKLIPNENMGILIDQFLKVADSNGHLPKAFLTGEDLKALGVSPSPQMGELLKQNYMAQIKGEIKSKNEALKWVKAKL